MGSKKNKAKAKKKAQDSRTPTAVSNEAIRRTSSDRLSADAPEWHPPSLVAKAAIDPAPPSTDNASGEVAGASSDDTPAPSTAVEADPLRNGARVDNQGEDCGCVDENATENTAQALDSMTTDDGVEAAVGSTPPSQEEFSDTAPAQEVEAEVEEVGSTEMDVPAAVVQPATTAEATTGEEPSPAVVEPMTVVQVGADPQPADADALSTKPSLAEVPAEVKAEEKVDDATLASRERSAGFAQQGQEAAKSDVTRGASQDTAPVPAEVIFKKSEDCARVAGEKTPAAAAAAVPEGARGGSEAGKVAPCPVAAVTVAAPVDEAVAEIAEVSTEPEPIPTEAMPPDNAPANGGDADADANINEARASKVKLLEIGGGGQGVHSYAGGEESTDQQTDATEDGEDGCSEHDLSRKGSCFADKDGGGWSFMRSPRWQWGGAAVAAVVLVIGLSRGRRAG